MIRTPPPTLSSGARRVPPAARPTAHVVIPNAPLRAPPSPASRCHPERGAYRAAGRAEPRDPSAVWPRPRGIPRLAALARNDTAKHRGRRVPRPPRLTLSSRARRGPRSGTRRAEGSLRGLVPSRRSGTRRAEGSLRGLAFAPATTHAVIPRSAATRDPSGALPFALPSAAPSLRRPWPRRPSGGRLRLQLALG